jgi:hypothetical protein
MPLPQDFRTLQLQAALFTPGLAFQNAGALRLFLTEFAEYFSTVQLAVELEAGAPPEIPRLIIQSADGRYKLEAGPSRLDLFRTWPDNQDVAAQVAHLDWCCTVFERYLQVMSARVGRLACVLTRLAVEPKPAALISGHFCRDVFTSGTGALNRPTDFQLHGAKRYRLGGIFDVNSWTRVKTGTVMQAPEEQRIGPGSGSVNVEQDINTFVEHLETRQFTADEIRTFFRMIPSEFEAILQLYFPAEA